MTKILNPLEKSFERSRYEAHVSRAQERFGWKPFALRFASLRNIAIAAKWSLPAVSVATATVFLVSALSTSLPYWVAIPAALLLLTGWEAAKSQLVKLSFEQHYANIKTSQLLFLLALLLSAGSVLMSMEGARKLYHLSDTANEQLMMTQQQQLDSLSKQLQIEVQLLKSEKKQFYKNNTVYLGKGKYALNHTVAKNYADYDNRISKLQQQLHQEKQQLIEKHKNEQQLQQADSHYQGWVIGIMAVVLDIMIVLAGWFVVFFDYRVLQEEMLVNKTSTLKNGFPVQETVAKQLLDNWRITPDVATPAVSTVKKQEKRKDKIGFSMPDTTVKNRDIQDKSATDFSGLADAVKSGIRDYRFLMHEFRANVLQVKQVIEQYG
ncbi:hypothetical protein V6R21_04130 [Limibacter armeniacum]|uniref:hypothetical protein n=1 Tax=Limibacter armeniacum TaxID=466084 RepID=UPI002FE56027